MEGLKLQPLLRTAGGKEYLFFIGPEEANACVVGT